MKIEEIIERLEQSTGASRYIDCHLWVVAKGGDARMKVCDASTKDFVWERGVDGFWIRDVVKFNTIPRYTDSVDAAEELCGRVLPGWYWRVGRTSLFPNGWAFVSRLAPDHCDREDEAACADGKADNPAIALCIAILKAKLAQECAA